MVTVRRVKKSDVNNYGYLTLRKQSRRSENLNIPALIEYRIPPMEFQVKLNELLNSNTKDEVVIYFNTNTNKFTFTNEGQDCIPIYPKYLESEQECGARFPARARINTMSELHAVREYFKNREIDMQVDRQALGGDKWVSVSGRNCVLTSFKEDEHIITCNHQAIVRDVSELIN